MNILKDLLFSDSGGDFIYPGYSIVAVHNGEDKVVLNITCILYDMVSALLHLGSLCRHLANISFVSI